MGRGLPIWWGSLSFLAKTADAKGKGLVDRLTPPIFESKGMGTIAIGVWLFGLLAAMIEDCHVHRPFRAAIPNPFGAAQEGVSGKSEQPIVLQTLSPSLSF